MSSFVTDPRFEHRLDEFTRSSDCVWLIALATGLTFTLIAANVFTPNTSGLFWACAGLMIRGGLYLWAGDGLHGKGGDTIATLFRVGLVAGVLEILVDWGLVHWVPTGRLVYLTGNDVVLLASPIWMPLAWACVFVEMSYPALRVYGRLRRRIPAGTARLIVSLGIGVLAGFTVGFYEYFAYRAHWWKYEPARVMIGAFCAVYIPVGECLMFLPVLRIAARAIAQADRPKAAILESGAQFAVAIAAGYAVAYVVVEMIM